MCLCSLASDNQLNIYGTGAVSLFDRPELAGDLIPQLGIEGLEEVGHTLTALAIMRIDAER